MKVIVSAAGACKLQIHQRREDFLSSTVSSSAAKLYSTHLKTGITGQYNNSTYACAVCWSRSARLLRHHALMHSTYVLSCLDERTACICIFSSEVCAFS